MSAGVKDEMGESQSKAVGTEAGARRSLVAWEGRVEQVHRLADLLEERDDPSSHGRGGSHEKIGAI